MLYRSAFLIVFAFYGLLFAGCGSGMPDLGQVEGTVTLDGQPLKGARVVFQPEGGRMSMGSTDAQGHYRLGYIRDASGARIGAHKIKITLADGNPQAETIPARYNRDTTLTVEVKPGNNTFDFQLTRNP